MSVYIQNGNRFTVAEDGSVQTFTKLPRGTYRITHDEQSHQTFLEKQDNLKTPGKIYGDYQQKAVRVLNTFMDKQTNMGVLLSGEKGTGKTLLAEIVANLGKQADLPIILVTTRIDTSLLTMFLKKISDRCVVLIDEFEKMFCTERYDDGQSGLLSLLDGLLQGNKLFVFTSNSTTSLNSNLVSRPGRIFYHFKFAGTTEDVIKEYCTEHLKNKNWIEEIITVSEILQEDFSFDVMQAVVEESNRYGESPIKTLEVLNVEPMGRTKYYTYTITKKEKKLITQDDEMNLDILKPFYVYYADTQKKVDDDDMERELFDAKCVVKRGKNKLVYKKGDFILTLVEKPIVKWSNRYFFPYEEGDKNYVTDLEARNNDDD